MESQFHRHRPGCPALQATFPEPLGEKMGSDDASCELVSVGHIGGGGSGVEGTEVHGQG